MADDDPDDCMIATEAFAESGSTAKFSCVEDGMQLFDFLSEHARPETRKLPSLILLDLNMPRKDGHETLVEIKSEPALRHIPVVILSTSEEPTDIDFTRSLGADSFVTKPANFQKWVEIMQSLAERWLTG